VKGLVSTQLPISPRLFGNYKLFLICVGRVVGWTESGPKERKLNDLRSLLVGIKYFLSYLNSQLLPFFPLSSFIIKLFSFVPQPSNQSYIYEKSG